MEVFKHDFLAYVGTFNLYLENLTKIPCRCKEVNFKLMGKMSLHSAGGVFWLCYLSYRHRGGYS